MKSPRLKLTTKVSILAVATALPGLMSAQDVRRADLPPGSTTSQGTPGGRTAPGVNAQASTPNQGVYIASIDVENRSLARYAGETLLNHQGAELGTIKDFVVHPPSNRVRYFVVSSGGIGGIGNNLRLVPFEVVRRGSRGRLFEAEILEAGWLQVPPINDEDYVVDRFNISGPQHRQMVQRFGSGAVATNEAGTDSNEFTGLIRASAIRGRHVFADDREVGEVEDIVISLERGTAGALLDSSGAFTGTTAKYIVPLNRLASMSTRPDILTTTLTRADFARAQPSEAGLAGNSAPSDTRRTGQPLTPTGRPAADAARPRAGDALAASAQSIRDALTHDTRVSGENVQVLVEDGRIVLRGRVQNETIRDNVENAARRATSGARIDNQITIVNR